VRDLLPRSPAFAGVLRRLGKYTEDGFPISETAAKESLALPVYPELTSDMIRFVCESIAKALT
jgi:dTDP-4-amino-4,6-dideoxygalactose transaminase